ncbi:hypothetical protein MBLNU230_g2464t1 [Neophaeotheca triangularis]
MSSNPNPHQKQNPTPSPNPPVNNPWQTRSRNTPTPSRGPSKPPTPSNAPPTKPPTPRNAQSRSSTASPAPQTSSSTTATTTTQAPAPPARGVWAAGSSAITGASGGEKTTAGANANANANGDGAGGGRTSAEEVFLGRSFGVAGGRVGVYRLGEGEGREGGGAVMGNGRGFWEEFGRQAVLIGREVGAKGG